ncbi:HAMP domain-containing protein, partial [uncultured Aquincola sp.]|uniref:HAMP domain-containing protein n=1 Tax=uncultured Aquincola sp. TaxID=886556 RepID=UPI0032B2FA36
MRIGLRLLLGFFLVLGLALFVVLRVFLEEVKPGTRLAMEDSLVDTAYSLAQLAAPDLKAGTIAHGPFAQAMRALPTLQPDADLWGFHKNRIHTRISITDARGIVVFDTRKAAVGEDHSRWNDVYKTLRGQYGARSSAESPGQPESTVMHVAAPVRDGDRIIGVLTVSRPNATLEPYIQRSRQRILTWSWGLLGISLAIGLLFTWWIVSSLSRLRGYALAVAQGERAELPRMGRLSGNTEFSDLAQAVERMRLKLEDKAYVERYVHTLT